MNFTNISQRIGFSISHEILKSSSDVTDVVNVLSEYAFLPTADSNEEDDDSLRLELITKDKKLLVVINDSRINVLRNKMEDEECLDDIQKHLDTANGIIGKLKDKFGFFVKDVTMESDFIMDSTDAVAKAVYNKISKGGEIPTAWRFNRMYTHKANSDNAVKSMEEESCLRDEVQLIYEKHPVDRLIVEITWGSDYERDVALSENLKAKCFDYFKSQISLKIEDYNAL